MNLTQIQGKIRHESVTPPPTADVDPSLQVTSNQVFTALARLNIRKAAGPDGVSARLLRECRDTLCEVLTILYYVSANMLGFQDFKGSCHYSRAEQKGC